MATRSRGYGALLPQERFLFSLLYFAKAEFINFYLYIYPIDRNPRQVIRPLAAPYNIAFAFVSQNHVSKRPLSVSHAIMHLKHCPSPPSARSWIVSYPPAKPYLVFCSRILRYVFCIPSTLPTSVSSVFRYIPFLPTIQLASLIILILAYHSCSGTGLAQADCMVSLYCTHS